MSASPGAFPVGGGGVVVRTRDGQTVEANFKSVSTVAPAGTDEVKQVPPHSTLNTQHSTLNTQHSTLNTRHSTLNTQHSTLNTQHSTLNTEQAAHALLARATDLAPTFSARGAVNTLRALAKLGTPQLFTPPYTLNLRTTLTFGTP